MKRPKEKRQISSRWMKGPLSSLSSLVGHIRDMRSSLYGGKSGFHGTLLPFIFCSLAHAHSCAHAHICMAHARSCTYCTQAGFALISDCFGFCGGLIRLLLKLRAKPACVCVSVWGSVCRSVMMDPQPVVGIAQFQLLLLALCSTGLIFFSPTVSCLTPVFHYYLAPAQEGLRYCS